jgi:hypothetical protein
MAWQSSQQETVLQAKHINAIFNRQLTVKKAMCFAGYQLMSFTSYSYCNWQRYKYSTLTEIGSTSRSCNGYKGTAGWAVNQYLSLLYCQAAAGPMRLP